ncbi:hypothetical protein R4Z10_09015 [Niallia sp. XMNu-256]
MVERSHWGAQNKFLAQTNIAIVQPETTIKHPTALAIRRRLNHQMQ